MTKRLSCGDIQLSASGIDGVGATGQELREQREALGKDLEVIAETLRIRVYFLEALEVGDYDALPGTAYAVGFVRSYARHLGMDGEKLARKFKFEVSGEAPTAKLDFLPPVQESRIPKGAIVLLMLLLAITIYGVWYYTNARDLTFTNIIPEVPLHFGRMVHMSAPTANDTTTLTTVPNANSSASGSTEKSAMAIASGGAMGDGAISSPAASGASPLAKAVSGVELAVLPPPAVPPPAATKPGPTTPQLPVAQLTTAAGQVSGGQTPAAVGAAALLPLPSKVAAAEPTPASTESALTTVSTRIEIRAEADSWVQLRTAEGTLLMTRIVSQGTSFVVPPQEGLRLTTGNAGGLKIIIDGVVVPALGPFGAVRRDVPLDPMLLKAGTAVVR